VKAMKIEAIAKQDYGEIIGLIKREFPYVDFDLARIEERVKSGRVAIFKAAEGKALLGFIEAEFLEEGIARINGLTVKEEHRKKGVAKNLVGFVLGFLKNKGVGRVLLLVRQENRAAKKVYEEAGFRFIGMYRRELDNAIVEEMELDFSPGKKEDLSYVG